MGGRIVRRVRISYPTSPCGGNSIIDVRGARVSASNVFFSRRLDPVLDRGVGDENPVVAPEVPRGRAVRQAVLHDQSDGHRADPMAVMAAGGGQVGGRGNEAMVTCRATVLGVPDGQVKRATRREIAEVVQDAASTPLRYAAWPHWGNRGGDSCASGGEFAAGGDPQSGAFPRWDRERILRESSATPRRMRSWSFQHTNFTRKGQVSTPSLLQCQKIVHFESSEKGRGLAHRIQAVSESPRR